MKQAVVGHGRATKQQIGYLVRALLAMRRTPDADAADALAIAICHARTAPRGNAATGAPRMIAFLRGDIIGDDGDAVIVGRRRRRLSGAAQRGDEGGAAGSGPVQMHIHAHFVDRRAAAPVRLLDDRGEARCSRRCSSVQGVGPRVALAILAGMETAELVRAIATSDVARLKQVKGVGGKLAERLALELREKILTAGPAWARVGREGAGACGGARRRARRRSGPLGEVYGALVLLGYKPAEIEPLLEKMDEKKPFDENVRGALAALRRG